MAFNKTKYVEAAQKHLNQGRIAQAIVEYQQILRHDPKDQITLMTVGDLYVRMGETFQALEYFEKLAQHFLNDGFVTKAIAIYKKIAKLAPEETRPLERLAELYVQQGILSEARPLYLQLAEAHLRANRHQQAITLLRALLEAEPENLRVQTRLAELYQTLGQPKEAADTLARAAGRMLERGEHAEAEKLADRALRIEATHAEALAIKARALAARGKHGEAIKLLEDLGGREPSSDATALLIDQHLQTGGTTRAAELAQEAFERSKQYELAYRVTTALADAGEAERALDLLGRIREAMLEANDSERLAQALVVVAERLPKRLEPREWLVDVYGRMNDSFRIPDALAQLAEAATAAGDLKRAREVYEQMLLREPENEATRHRLNQVRAQLGLDPVEEPAALGPGRLGGGPVVEAKPVPKSVEPPLEEETQRFVTQALTDVDLFSSYGLAQKAVDLLETVLKRVPRYPPALEKLLDLSLGAGHERRTAELAAQLEEIYQERGDSQNTERFSELRRRFQRAAGLTQEEVAAATDAARAAESDVPTVEAAPLSAPEAQSAVHEIDLSEEWAALSKRAQEAPPEPEAASEPEPAREPAPPVEEPAAEPVEVAAEETPAPPSVPEVSEPAEHPPEPVPAAESADVMSSEEFLSELSKLGVQAAAPGPAGETAPVAAAPPPDADLLGDVIAEFRAELGEMDDEKEDLETHYNLGIAYREMGLLDEAIGEFQKVAQANEKGRKFRYAMQCCTLLGLSFMDKSQPGIAAMWYERALQTPGLEPESVMALRYDLGVAQQMAGEEAAALKNFSQVYAMNIDYRDVAERLAALGKRR